MCYDPAHVYTFHVRQHIVDVANYKIPIRSMGRFNLLPYLKGQPIRFMAYDRSSEQHLWNLEACTTPQRMLPCCRLLCLFLCTLPLAGALCGPTHNMHHT